jgi:drug/metabolite transporter superfamily protein YnfA
MNSKLTLLREFWLFLKERKKLWLLPIVIVLGLFGVLLILGESSALAPFIYSIF